MKINHKASSGRALLVSQRPSDYVEMRRCAKTLKNKGWEIHFLYFHGETGSDTDIIASIKQEENEGDFSHVELRQIGMGRRSKTEASSDRLSSFTRLYDYLLALSKRIFLGKIKEFLTKYTTLLILYNSVRIVCFYLSEKRALKGVVKTSSPDVIIVPEDVVGYISPLIIKAGHELNIPTVIIPYTIANEQEAFKSLCGNAHYHLKGIWNRAMGKLFPNWVMSQDGVSLVRMPAPYILGQILTKTSPPNPWMMNSGFANVIAVENLAMKHYYLQSGIPKKKIRVVGSISDDHLAQFKNNKAQEVSRLKGDLHIEGDKPILVVGGCPDQSGCCPSGFEYSDFHQFIVRLGTLLKPLTNVYDVIFRPHPNNLEMGIGLEKYGIIVTEFDTARLVALSDVYLAFASATIRWAIACEVPVVNYDLFHYDYDDFKGVPGVLTVASEDSFKNALESLRPNCDKFRDLQRDAKLAAHRWGMLDGKSADRIVALIEEMCAYEDVVRASE